MCLFGGSTQLVLTWFIGVTGDPLFPAYYLILANAICIVAIYLLKETRGQAID